MQILITGGLGQIGSYLTEELSKDDNYNITIIDNFSSSVKNMKVPEAVEVIQEDIRDQETVNKLVSKSDVIIHAAAQTSVERSVNDPVFDAENNILGTLNLLNAAKRCENSRFIYFSSAAAYGNPQYLPIDEEHPTNPLSPYGLSKLTGEKYCTMFNELYDLPAVCIRPFNIYSSRQDPNNPYSGVISKFIERVRNNESPMIFGDGSQTRDFVSVYDVVDFVSLTLESDEAIGKVFNVGTGVPTSIKELAEMIISLFEKDLEVVYASTKKGDIKDSYADISKARKIEYWPKVALEEGLKEILKTCKSQ